MLSEQKAKKVLKILLPLFILLASIFVCSNKVPEWEFVKESAKSLEKNEDTVITFSGATIATSVTITLLPDDFASPLASEIMDFNKYFLIILVAIFIEKILITEGIKVAFIFILPLSCIFYIISNYWKKEVMKSLAVKFAVVALLVAFVVPCSTHFAEYVGKNYMAYVDETIESTTDGANKIQNVMQSDDDNKNIFEKVSGVLAQAISGVQDMMDYFYSVIKKWIISVAILIVTNCVIPVCVLLFLIWMIKALFGINSPVNHTLTISPKNMEDKIVLEEKE